MFVGDEDPIEKVYYGSQLLYPHDPELDQGTKCLVETFEKEQKRHYRIYIVSQITNIRTTHRKYDYREDDNKVNRIIKLMFVKRNSRTMYINIDISSDKIHPFMDKTIDTSSGNNIIKYKMKKDFNKAFFNGKSTIKYKFGNVYDSTTPIVVGYKIFDEFMTEADSLSLYYKNDRLEGLSCHKDSTTLNYVKNDNGLRTLWFAIPDLSADLIDDDKILAQSVLNKPEIQFLSPELLMLDVSELMTPSLFGIDKTVGTRGIWDYTLYSVNKKYKQFFKLAKIVDSLRITPLIHSVGDYAIETIVERYEISGAVVLFVTSTIPGPVGNFKNVIGFSLQNCGGRDFWNQLTPNETTNYIGSLERSGPIEIDVSIRDEPTSVYSDETSFDQNGFYLNISINEPDGLAIEEGKYVFGKIKDKQPYEEGNIPSDPFQKTVIYLSEHANTPNVVVTNSTVPRPLCYSDRREYHTILVGQN
ncbi:hypothetical protein MACK_002035 [Theileria orientalis]|uniref:Uncharacterized protein n=1 Tax=Theileria orientalis TaxID=68886 RepID=A0A976MBF3_THEOR|nr:hypothetical protein MACK_002035 [Theileria orientalis]